MSSSGHQNDSAARVREPVGGAAWAFLLVLAVLLMLQIAGAFRTNSAESELVFATVQPGQVLPNIELRPERTSQEPGNGIKDLFGGECGIAIFYLSSCPACQKKAPQWSDLDSVNIGTTTLPIAWIGASGDTAAPSFLRHYNLKGVKSYARGLKEWASIGIRGTPSVYLIEGGVFHAKLPTTPAAIIASEARCAKTSTR